jgi:N-acetylglucosaminyl-diphospho-decaprenol L-rhamnosyltransferase
VDSRSDRTQVLSCDVVIVTHNSGPLLGDAVASAVGQAGAQHVWVIDAESTDGSVEALRAGPGSVKVLPVTNAGFAAGNNRGIEAGDAPFVLLLNPDAALLPGALPTLLATAQTHPRAGIVGALVLNADGTMQANSYGRFPTLRTVIGLHLWRIGQRLRGNSILSPQRPASTTSVDWVTGAAMLVRREAIAEVGSLDEGFFLYYEDVDWCRRMRARGWEVLLEPAAHVVHHLGRSAASSAGIAKTYRASFFRYCDLYGLRGLKTSARLGLTLRRLFGDRH